MKGFRWGRNQEIRVRSRKGIVHLKYSRNSVAFCGARLADGRITTRGAVTCSKCVELRESESMVRFESHGDQDEQRKHDAEYRKKHRVTNTYRAAKRGNRYLAHWVLEPRRRINRTDRTHLTEHRLYVRRNNYRDMTYYCPDCERIGKRTGPDGLPRGDIPGTPLQFLEEFVEARSFAGNLEPDSPGDIAPDDLTIHETGRKMPRDESEARREERMLADLRAARAKWDVEHEPSMVGDSPQ